MHPGLATDGPRTRQFHIKPLRDSPELNYDQAVKRLILGVAVAALLSSSAAASTGGTRDAGWIELCGPSGCARTTNQGAYDQLKAFLPQRGPSHPIGFPPAVQPYYTLHTPGLQLPAVYLGSARQLGVTLAPGTVTWTSLGGVTVGALQALRGQVRPFPAPLPTTVQIDRKTVRPRAIYRHLFDAFPRVYNLQPSSLSWVSVSVTWPRGTPWQPLTLTLRRNTRIMLRPDYAVRISKALARRIAADTPRKR
jgi:hypothetical protein